LARAALSKSLNCICSRLVGNGEVNFWLARDSGAKSNFSSLGSAAIGIQRSPNAQYVVCKNQSFQRASFPHRIWDSTQILLPKVEKHIVGHSRDGTFACAHGSSSALSPIRK